MAADLDNPTEPELKAMREWLISDWQVKTIILRTIGASARKLIPRSSDTEASFTLITIASMSAVSLYFADALAYNHFK